MDDLTVKSIASALGRFANAMRLYGEAFIRYRDLVAIDQGSRQAHPEDAQSK
ncbi:hypothetical protein ACNPIB_13745 [Klebsiella pneumoniae]|jgi:hypothetical protein